MDSRFMFTVGTTVFPTKGAAGDYTRQVLNEAEIDEKLVGDRGVFVRHLFGMHPRAAEKAARGVAGFMVRTNDVNGAKTRGFHVLHDDGGTTAFSYAPCLNPKKPELGAAGAMRAAIMLGQRRVMVEYFGGRNAIPCPSCGRPMTKATAHVHHVPPQRFRDIASAYVADFGLPPVEKAALGVRFTRPGETQRWLEFHDARAKRTVICAPCNYAAERDQ